MMLKHLPVLAALSLLAGCAVSPWTVDAFEAPGTDMAGRSTFFMKQGDVAAPIVSRTETGVRLESQVRAAIIEELQRKGYVETTDAQSAAMVVTFMVAGTRKFVEPEQRRVGAPAPNEVLMSGGIPPRPASEMPPEKSVRAVSMVVYVDDPVKQSLMWRGLVETELRTSSNDMLIRRLADMARHITQQAPARRATP
jgi:hypothetical protein